LQLYSTDLLKEITTAFQAYFKAHQFILHKNNYKWFFLAGILYAVLFTAGLVIFYNSSAAFTETLIRKTNIQNWLHSGNDLLTYLFITSMIMFNWVLLLYYFSLLKYIFLILCSPAFSYISLKTSSLNQKKQQLISGKELFQLSKRGVGTALKNLGWQTLYFILFLLLSLVPVIGWIIPIVALITEFYFYGFSTTDYKLKTDNFSPYFAQKYIQKHKGLAIGNGLCFYLMHLIPVIGWIAAPVYSIVASFFAIEDTEVTHIEPEIYPYSG
jgi:CysZ protein